MAADVAQLVEHHLGKVEVTGSIPVISSTEKIYGCSSAGRAAVSKTAGRGFESCRPCRRYNRNYSHRRCTMVESIRGFFADVSKEMKKVSWPTKEQLRESTMVVVATCLVFAALVFVIDRGVVTLLELIY